MTARLSNNRSPAAASATGKSRTSESAYSATGRVVRGGGTRKFVAVNSPSPKANANSPTVTSPSRTRGRSASKNAPNEEAPRVRAVSRALADSPARGISRLWSANGRARIDWLTITSAHTFEPVPMNGRQNDARAKARTTGDRSKGTKSRRPSVTARSGRRTTAETPKWAVVEEEKSAAQAAPAPNPPVGATVR